MAGKLHLSTCCRRVEPLKKTSRSAISHLSAFSPLNCHQQSYTQTFPFLCKLHILLRCASLSITFIPRSFLLHLLTEPVSQKRCNTSGISFLSVSLHCTHQTCLSTDLFFSKPTYCLTLPPAHLQAAHLLPIRCPLTLKANTQHKIRHVSRDKSQDLCPSLSAS